MSDTDDNAADSPRDDEQPDSPPVSIDSILGPGTLASIARVQEIVTSPLLKSATAAQNDLIKRAQAAIGPIMASLDSQRMAMVESLQPLFRVTLSSSGNFRDVDPAPSSYSAEMHGASSYFERDEEEITSFDELNRAISRLIAKFPDLELVWRGQQSADWGLHSSLFRSLMAVNGVKAPAARPRRPQPYPDEDQMVAVEKTILNTARNRWRLDGMPALEIFARLQHHGAPTRLIDVTRNPYIGAWFAVESSQDTDKRPGRLFAIATGPVLPAGQERIDTSVRLDETGGSRDPFWHALENTPDRQGADWGTGSKRRIWVPPAYDARISAQNAAFLLDGVPMMSAAIAPYFKIGTTSTYWKKADLLAASSIYLKTAKPGRLIRPNAPNLAPAFSFVITSKGKEDIRRVLEERFSYDHASIYPDVSGLAMYLRENLDHL